MASKKFAEILEIVKFLEILTEFSHFLQMIGSIDICGF